MKSTIIFILVLYFFTEPALSANCALGCTDCVNVTICSACEETYTFIQRAEKCLKCPPNCLECTYASGDGFTCQTCTDDFELNSDGECFKCDPMCETCSNTPTNCTSCKEGLVQEDNGQETHCVRDDTCQAQDCARCSPASGNVCERCKFGFFNFQGNCIECGYPCGECEYETDRVYYGQVKPFLQNLRNASGNTRRRLQDAQPPLDAFNDDLDNLTERDKSDYALGKIIFDMLTQDTNYNDQEKTQIANEMVNKQREQSNAPLDDRIIIMADQYERSTGTRMSPQHLKRRLHMGFMEDTTCHGCHRGFLFNTTTDLCQKCSKGCVDCNMNGCLECHEGLSLKSDNSGCERCRLPCRTCEDGDKTSCLSCFPPAKLTDDNKCVQCKGPCQTCEFNTPQLCETCKSPYSHFADAEKKCFRCPDFKCRHCNPDNKDECYECRQGFTLSDAGKCEGCPDFCTDCDLSGNSPACYECQLGYALVNNECLPCGGKGCLECAQSSRNTCIKCFDGFFVNDDGECQQCSKICQNCVEAVSCEKYKKGLVEFFGKIVGCRKGCADCNPLDPEKCTECNDGFYLASQNKCRRCEKGCAICNSNGVCTRARKRWVLHTDGSNLVEKCQGRCLSCDQDDLSVCTACPMRLTLNDQNECVRKCTDKKCLRCHPDHPDQCFKCARGFTARLNGKCDKCLGTCSGYCNPLRITECLECAPGFQLVDNGCQRCSRGCLECYGDHCARCKKGFERDVVNNKFVCVEQCTRPCEKCRGRVCTQCAEDFILRRGKCIPDVSCNPNCDFCEIGTYKANSGNCEKCEDNCATCTGNTCEECNDGYYSKNGDCEACPGDCAVCADEVTCTTCKDGFVREVISEEDGEYEYSGACTSCKNCLTCQDQPDICVTCDDNHKINGTKCIGRFVTGFQFKLDKDFAQFLDESGLMNVIEAIADQLGVDVDVIVINNLSQGSTDVDGVVSAENADDANSNADALANADLGYGVLSSSINVYYDDQVYVPEEEDDLPLGIIIGCSVGGVVLIGIIIFVVYKCKQKKAQTGDEIGEQSMEGRKEWGTVEVVQM